MSEKIAQPVSKLCLFGPESVGKTTMARQLATEYQTVFVPEVARDLITSNEFSLDDIVRIGHAQTQAVLAAEQKANRILFCDTDVITTQIYSDIYLGQVPPVLYELEQQIQYDAYVLLDIDVPWVADGLRDLGHRRTELMTRFKTELDHRNLPYVLVSGSYSERLTTVRQLADQLLNAPGSV
ncbi:ATP-binding protein [Spirosoma taeanense]|uniref:ATP-binding protein n=1 Tax=Spirosoma taeanense TaxID=2735870 RepID=A0A6M5Y756_9BACT|nr:ATP-binding protein [Spirosoma taeanense]QJW88542.1 ATP-binding protein [Spirosoma taeanense]